MSQWTKLYNNRRWRKKRQALLDREPLCRECRKLGKVTVATVADHVIEHRGDPDLFWHGELQPLCSNCHSSYKQRVEKRGHDFGCDVSGAPFGRADW